MDKSVKNILIFIAMLHFMSFDRPVQEKRYALTIKVQELRNSKGVVQFTLYNKEGSIPDERFRAYCKQGTAPITNSTSSITFSNLPEGRYAVNILHDENENGKIDKGFILPIEGVGFSNYESIGLSNRPKFSQASFELDSEMTKSVTIIYK